MSSGRAVVLSAALAALVAVLLAGCGADATPQAPDRGTGSSTLPTRTLKTAPGTETTPAAPARSAAPSLSGPLAFNVKRRTQLRLTPGGRVVGTIRTKTNFHSPTILAVAARRPGWVLVRTSIEKHHVGWLPLSAGHLFEEPRSIVVDLSKRRLMVFHRGKLTDAYKVAVGTNATPTPIGKFAVTDRLTTGNAQSDYGCCILALTAHQPKILQGWGGGDRVAIHATPHTWTLGNAISHGCVRASNDALRQLMRHARLGMPVTIRA
ncbi:L,D-transpeptidase [Conexibacter woesei]|uniref:L,D-transpeptidase n=1 Tax=Conexibacter woesei TaxID=191495 RepID=UPI00047E0BEA|nr:L,D-transpeptidase [Conexibacter woesei]